MGSPDIAHDKVTVFCYLRHHFFWSFSIFPQLGPIIQIQGHKYALLLGDLYRLQAKVGDLLADSWTNRGEMEPFDICKHLMPIDTAYLQTGKRRMCPIVNHGCVFE